MDYCPRVSFIKPLVDLQKASQVSASVSRPT